MFAWGHLGYHQTWCISQKFVLPGAFPGSWSTGINVQHLPLGQAMLEHPAGSLPTVGIRAKQLPPTIQGNLQVPSPGGGASLFTLSPSLPLEVLSH